MRRREFILAIAAAAAGTTVAARAQGPAGRMPRVAVLRYANQEDAEDRALLAAFMQQLEAMGWHDDKNVVVDIFWGRDAEDLRRNATEAVSRQPDVIVAGSAAARAALNATQDRPIVFVNINDPIALGLVRDLAHPGGNVTGFYNYDVEMAGKWLEVLREIAPDVGRVVVLGSSDIPSYRGWVDAVQDFSRAQGIEVSAPEVRTSMELEEAVAQESHKARAGLLVLAGGFVSLNRDVIIAAAKRYRVPAIYPRPAYSHAGGLLSYGVDIADLYRRSAAYVDRILKGANPGELPVQGPIKFELVINLSTAGELGLEVPQRLRLLADELIK